MSREDVEQFPALRPHQRPSWHMFLVQLAALALWTEKRNKPPVEAYAWRVLLRGLTSNYPDDAPWRMVVENRRQPAFLQPPALEHLKWKPVATPDALDLLITAKNHDQKQQVARDSTIEDWMFSLISLQTSAGYDGKGNYGIARMNGGSSSRPMLGLAPSHRKNYQLNPSTWWLRDVQRLLAHRQSGSGSPPGRVGGPAILWCLDWPEGKQLDLRELDPWFIEVCRRVRLRGTEHELSAVRANSTNSLIDANMFHGQVGDPWAPVHRKEGKSLTLGGGNFNYKRLSDLMFSGDWEVPVLAEIGPDENTGDRLLVAEALSRGNSKTEGFKSRVVPVPDRVLRLFQSQSVADLSKTQMQEIKAFDEALRNALALLAARGVLKDVGKSQYAFSMPARMRFDRHADNVFFPHLWKRLAAENSGSTEEADQAGHDFRRVLFYAALTELTAALPGVPCQAIQRPRAEVRARRVFHSRVYKLDAQLYSNFKIPEPVDANA